MKNSSGFLAVIVWISSLTLSKRWKAISMSFQFHWFGFQQSHQRQSLGHIQHPSQQCRHAQLLQMQLIMLVLFVSQMSIQMNWFQNTCHQAINFVFQVFKTFLRFCISIQMFMGNSKESWRLIYGDSDFHSFRESIFFVFVGEVQVSLLNDSIVTEVRNSMINFKENFGHQNLLFQIKLNSCLVSALPKFRNDDLKQKNHSKWIDKTLGRLQSSIIKNFPSSMNRKLLATCSRTSTYFRLALSRLYLQRCKVDMGRCLKELLQLVFSQLQANVVPHIVLTFWNRENACLRSSTEVFVLWSWLWCSVMQSLGIWRNMSN